MHCYYCDELLPIPIKNFDPVTLRYSCDTCQEIHEELMADPKPPVPDFFKDPDDFLIDDTFDDVDERIDAYHSGYLINEDTGI